MLVKHREAIVAAAKREKALSVALVGSTARGEDTADSDLDFLVEFKKDITLFGIGRLEADLQDMLGCDVDVIPTTCVRDSYKATMARDAVLL